MSDSQPVRPDHEMYTLLQDENLDEFNRRRAEGDDFNLAGLDLRALDLRGLNTKGLDLTDSYLRNANLAGLDLSVCNLEGASIFQAHISGALFPKELAPEEIRLSIEFGTRLRNRA
ncbi:pentapeptide repeat-containing protein [Candidatus Neomarinimicrobiota bacterium]